jgi:hypothetical protein
MNKTFKGLLADGEVKTIRLSTKDGLTGYKIVKFQLFPEKPGQDAQESIVIIESLEPSAATGTVNFDSPTLLAVSLTANDTNLEQGRIPPPDTVVIDNKMINQDIYISHKDMLTGAKCNFYIELEQVKLELNEATVATLKDMRARE